MAHLIETDAKGAAKMVAQKKAWHFWETNHPILAKAATEQDFKAWADQSGLSEEYEMTQAYQSLGMLGEGEEAREEFAAIPDLFHCRRKADFKVFGTFTEQYKVFQPIELINFGREFIAVDDRFSLETAMTLKGGALLVANFGFQETIEVLGNPHMLWLLLSTAMDGSRSTTFQGVMGDTVCHNTFSANQRGAQTFKLSHRSEWNKHTKAQAKASLIETLKGAAQYKKMAEALERVVMSEKEVMNFLESLIFTAKQEEVELANGATALAWSKPGTQEKRRIEELKNDYMIGVEDEKRTANSAWAIFSGITRYADHTVKAVKRGDKSEDMARDESRLFGGGATFKSKAVAQLLKQLNMNQDSFKVEDSELSAMGFDVSKLLEAA